MKVIRTEHIYIRENSTISGLCHLSKNLYNQVNYVLRQQYLNHERLMGYNELVKKFSAPSDVDDHNNYQKLPAQWTIKKVKQSWNSFFKAMKVWEKHPEEFMRMPKPPKYKNKDGEFILIFSNQQCHI
ncbi:MAG: RNA-guided endonuclease TnpB family protein, partial [Thermoplasmata archaeon]